MPARACITPRPGRSCRRLAERLAIPVTTSLGGKSSFPETHPLSLGSGGLAVPRAVPKFLGEADVIFGIGCSFTETSFGIAMPKGKTIIHSTLDPNHLNKDVEAKIGLVGDAGLVLDALAGGDRQQRHVGPRCDGGGRRDRGLAQGVAGEMDAEADASTMRRSIPTACCGTCSTPSTSRTPSSPTMPAARATSSRRSGRRSSRCRISAGARPRSSATASASPWAPSWRSPTSSASTSGATPRSASPAWTSRPRCASASRSCRSCLNNFSMAIELKVMPISTEKYRSTDISGDYAAMARAFGGYGERVTEARRHHPRHQARHSEDQGRHPGAAGVHHQQGDRGLEAGDLTRVRNKNAQNNPMQSRRRRRKRYLVTPPSPPGSKGRPAAVPP